MTTFQRETDQPVIGFDMGGNLVMIINRPFPIYLNSNLAPRLGGIKQKK